MIIGKGTSSDQAAIAIGIISVQHTEEWKIAFKNYFILLYE